MATWVCGICKVNGIDQKFSELGEAMEHLGEHMQKRGPAEEKYEDEFNKLVAKRFSNN